MDFLKNSRCRQIAGTFLFLLALLFSLLSVGYDRVYASQTDPEMKIYAINLESQEKGDCVLLESGGHYLLMDLGQSTHAPTIIHTLHQLGVTRVDIYFSHLHKDHVGGASDNILSGITQIADAGISINTLYMPDPSLASLSVDYPAKYQKFRQFMAGRGNIRYLKVGDKVEIGDAELEVIGPVNTWKFYPDKYAGMANVDTAGGKDARYTYYENNCSLASVVTCGGVRFFTAGDCLKDEADELSAYYGSSLDCDLMKLSHHGTGGGNTKQLLSLISPSYSFATNNTYTGKNALTGKWQTAIAGLRADQYGPCFFTASEQKTALYQVKDGSIQMKIGADVTCCAGIRGWLELVGADGKCRTCDYYYFSKAGVPLTGCRYIKDRLYDFGSGGCMKYGRIVNGVLTGWRTEDGQKRYYLLSEDGKYASISLGFQWVDGTLYYFGANGALLRSEGSRQLVWLGSYAYAVGTGGAITTSKIQTVSQKRYYFDENGRMQSSSLISYKGKWYFFRKTGVMLAAEQGTTETFTFRGNEYRATDTGVLISKTFYTQDEKCYYYDENARLLKDSFYRKGTQFYYFGSDGARVSDLYFEKLGKWYYADQYGDICSDGVCEIRGKLYYFDPDGSQAFNAFRKVSGNLSYFGRYGNLVRGKMFTLAGKTYYADQDGSLAHNAFVNLGRKTYYFDGNYQMAVNRFVKRKGNTCYVGKYGTLVKNKTVVIGGKEYTFDADGYLLKKQGTEENNGSSSEG